MSDIAPGVIEPGNAFRLMPLYDALNCLSLAALFTDDGDQVKAEAALTEVSRAALHFAPGSAEAECLDRLIAIVREARVTL